MIIGLTGGIGSGKSTVSAYLKQKGYTIVDADQIGRDLVVPGSPALREITETFCEDIILDDGNLDRRKLGQIVFENPEKLELLNSILSIRIKDEIDNQLKNSKTEITILDAPLLFESGLDKKTEQVWVVDAKDEIRLDRTVKRGPISEEEIKSRMKAQMEREERLSGADVIIDNSGTLEETYRQVDLALERLNVAK